MSDQAATLRSLVGATSHFAKVITFSSGKGGVGKSNLLCNLSIQLAGLGHRVAILDMDLGLANLDILLGLSPRFNLSHVMAGQKSLTDIICPGPNDIMFVPGASGVSRLANLRPDERESLIEKFAELETMADLIMVDTGAGLSDNVLHFALASNSLIVVTTPEPTARMDAYALIKTIMNKNPNLPVYVILNEAHSPREAEQVFRSLSQVCKQHLPKLPIYLGHIPLDLHVSKAVQQRKPFILEYPHCPASKSLVQVSGEFQKLLLPHSAQREDPNPKTFLSRLFSLFS